MKSIKVIGLSGSGKSTLIGAISKARAGIVPVTYSDYLRRYGREADAALRHTYVQANDLIIADDHLEFGCPNLESIYYRENTVAIVALESSVDRLLQQRLMDSTRIRSCDRGIIELQSECSRSNAYRLATELGIPLLLLRDATINESLSALDSIITAVRHA